MTQNGNVKVRWLLGAAGGLLATGAMWYITFNNDRVSAHAVVLTEHAVDIAATKATHAADMAATRGSFLRVEKAVGRNADKLDRLLERKD